MITNINTGVDPARIQQGQPPYFVNWKDDGEQNYEFFPIVSSMYKLKERMMRRQITKSISVDGAWYSTQNYEVYTAKEFIDKYGELLSDLTKKLILDSVGRIQRTCDSYCIELI